jgi:4,5-dihydroxyphthalate decarboxylase
MSGPDSPRHFTVAIGHRYDFWNLIEGRVKPEGLDVEYPPVTTGAPAPIFSRLAREHPWDIGEQGFSTYLMAFDLGKPQVALPVFPSRFFPHAGLWVNEQAGIASPHDLVGKRIGCASWGTNYSVWCRGVLAHQYDVPTQKITWVESVDEHLTEFRPPKRYTVERAAEETRQATLLSNGTIDAATMAGGGIGTDVTGVRPLFADPYPEIRAYAQANGFFPINTVITVRKDAVERNPDMPRLMMDAFLKAKALYDAELEEGTADEHMGLSLSRLRADTGLQLTDYGFNANRNAIRTMIAYCYEQGIIKRLVEPEDLFLATDS